MSELVSPYNKVQSLFTRVRNSAGRGSLKTTVAVMNAFLYTSEGTMGISRFPDLQSYPPEFYPLDPKFRDSTIRQVGNATLGVAVAGALVVAEVKTGIPYGVAEVAAKPVIETMNYVQPKLLEFNR